jgi:predicted nucleotidyltransferase
MIEGIKRELLRLEAENSIKILYAVESGSRAWGFASTDSDWDVRFITSLLQSYNPLQIPNSNPLNSAKPLNLPIAEYPG